MRWNGVLRCLFLRKSSFFEPKGSLNWHCLDPATHESHPCSCTFSFARNLLSQCRFRSLSSHSNADAIPCTNTMGLLSQYGGDKQQHVRYYSQNSKAERITWENYLNTWKNFNKSQGDIRQAVTEWQDAGFPSVSFVLWPLSYSFIILIIVYYSFIVGLHIRAASCRTHQTLLPLKRRKTSRGCLLLKIVFRLSTITTPNGKLY